MKATVFLLTFLLTFSSLCVKGDNLKSYIKWVKEECGDYTPSTDDYDNVRETKMYGDSYLHTYQNTIDGKGKITKKYKWWLDTEKTINFSHTAKAILREEITSTKKELEKGIVKSEFTVMNFTENFGICRAGGSFGIISSNDVLKGLVKFGMFINNQQSIISKATGTAIAASISALLAPVPEPGHKAAALTTLLVASGIEGASRLTGWLLGSKLSNNVDEKGNIIMDGEKAKKYFPEFEKVLFKLRKLEGTRVVAVWEQGKGYTKIDIATTSDMVSEEDKQLIVKMIYRTNPVGVRNFYPKDKENAKKWVVKAKDFEAVLSLCGIKFNRLLGDVQVRHRGTKDRKDYQDEEALGRKVVPVVTLDIDKNYPNFIKFNQKVKDAAELDIKLIPSGKIMIATKKLEENAPTYIREISCTGNFENILRKHIKPDSMLLYVDMEESSIKVQGSYQQIRFHKVER